ncbi:MAG: type II toxin-antitoxin system RelE/ParE family toxin [Pirellulales bacterium]|nr:type II toxin-antitoxin system RelE/ParE family toxin [Pirellulales bacterium]
MSFRVKILASAWRDADAIFDWIRARSPVGAARWYVAFLQAAKSLADSPFIHGMAPDIEALKRDVRQRFFRTSRGRIYRLLYVVVQKEVRVLCVRGPGQPPVMAADVAGES